MLVGTEMVVDVVGALDAFVHVPAAMQLLVLLDQWSEGEFSEAAAHGDSRKAQVGIGWWKGNFGFRKGAKKDAI